MRLVVDNSATVLGTAAFDAYGNLTAGTLYDGFGYTGQKRDGITLLYSNGNGTREYLPDSGVWLQSDPRWPLTGEANPFMYVRNSPTNGADPSGLDKLEYAQGMINWKVDPGPKAKDGYAWTIGKMTGDSRFVEINVGGDWIRVPTWNLDLYIQQHSLAAPNGWGRDDGHAVIAGLLEEFARAYRPKPALASPPPVVVAPPVASAPLESRVALSGHNRSISPPLIVAGDRDFIPWRWKKVIRGDDLIIVDAQGNPQVEVRRVLADGTVEATVRPARVASGTALRDHPRGPKGEILPRITPEGGVEIAIPWRGQGATAEYAVVSIPTTQLNELAGQPRMLRMPRPDLYGLQKPTRANLAALPRGIVTESPFLGFDLRTDLTPGRHALGGHIIDARLAPYPPEISPYFSSSQNPRTLPWGKSWWIDTDAVREAGGEVLTNEQLRAAVQRELSRTGATGEEWYRAQLVEQEALLKAPRGGAGVIPARGIKSTPALAISVVGKGITIVGLGTAADDLRDGLLTSIDSRSVQPALRSTIRQTGALSGAVATGKMTAILLGPASATPPGMAVIILFSLGGGIVGYYSADAVAQAYDLPAPVPHSYGSDPVDLSKMGIDGMSIDGKRLYKARP